MTVLTAKIGPCCYLGQEPRSVKRNLGLKHAKAERAKPRHEHETPLRFLPSKTHDVWEDGNEESLKMITVELNQKET